VERGSGNSRNDASPKTLFKDRGEVPVAMLRDRDGSCEPRIVAKSKTHFDGFDKKIVSVYGSGMRYDDIQGHLADICGLEISKDLLTRVTEAVLRDLGEWQHRPLDRGDPIVRVR